MRRILLFLALLMPSILCAQSTVVSGTVIDGDGQHWFAGTFQVTFIPSVPGQYTWTGGPFGPAQQNVQGLLDGTGHYSVSLPSNNALSPSGSHWQLTVTSATRPALTSTQTLSLVGGTLTVNFTPPPIRFGATVGGIAYISGEVSSAVIGDVINFIAGAGIMTCSTVVSGACTVWTPVGGGGGGSCPNGLGFTIQVTNGAACVGDNNFTWDGDSLTAQSPNGTGDDELSTGPNLFNRILIRPTDVNLTADESGANITIEATSGSITSTAGTETLTRTAGGDTLGSPTGGAKGAATLNAVGLFVNGVAVGTTTGTVTNVSGTANQIDVATPTTTPVLSLDPTLSFPGTFTQSHVATFSANAAASAPSVNFTGLVFAGNGTTSTPSVYINQSVTAPTTWNITGTAFGMNLAAGTGRAIDIHTGGGASIFSVDAAGGVSSASITSSGSIEAAAGSALGLNARSQFRSLADGRMSVNTTANGSNGMSRFTFGTEAANNPAFFFDGSTAAIYAADGTGAQSGGILGSAQWVTPTACLQSVSPAACGANVTGRIALAAAATTLVVNTSKVTAASEILVQRDDSLGAALGVTCNTQSTLVLGTPRITARTAATSFTITVDAGPTTNPLCMTYYIIN